MKTIEITPRLTSALLAASLFCGWGLPSASAQGVPSQTHFQGRLTDASNNPLTGPNSFVFEIYDASAGGNLLWTETQPAVPVANGVFAVQLGSATPLPSTVFSGATAYLQVTVNGSVMTPREQLVASPYAHNAGLLAGRSYAAFVSTDAATQSIAGTKTFTGSVFVPAPTAPGHAATKAYVDAASGTGLLASTNAWSGQNSFLNAVSVSSGVTAASGTFTASGPAQFSLQTSSGLSVGGTGGVYANFFSGSFHGDGSGITGLSGTDASKVAKTGDTMTGQLTLSGSSQTIVDTNALDAYSLAVTSSSDRSVYHMAVTTAGLVGVGTAAPAAALHVTARGGNPVGQIIQQSDAAQTANLLQMENSAGAVTSWYDPVTLRWNWQKPGGNGGYVGMVAGGANGLELGTIGSDPIQLGANASGFELDGKYVAGRSSGLNFITNVSGTGTSVLRLIPGTGAAKIAVLSSDFGIGTAAPANTLDVNGGTVFRSSSTWAGSAAPLASAAGQGAIYFDTAQNKFLVSENGGTYAPLSAANGNFVSRAGDAMTGPLTLSGSTLTVTGSAFSVGGSTLVVAGGYVGVGAAPTRRLYALDNAAQETVHAESLNANGIGLLATSPSDGVKTYTTGSGAALRAVADGDGTAVAALIGANRNATGVSINSAGAGTSAKNLLEITHDNSSLSGDAILVNVLSAGNGSFTGSLLDLQVTGASKLRVDAAGRVGIGTAAPAAPLDVNGASQFGSGAVKSTFTAAGSLTLASGASMTLSGASGVLASASSVTASAFFGDGSHLMGVLGTDASRVAKAGDAMTGQLELSSAAVVIDGTGPAVPFQVGASTFAVLQSGNVGVGTAGPNAALEVVSNQTLGTNAPVARFRLTAGGNNVDIVNNDGSGSTAIITPAVHGAMGASGTLTLRSTDGNSNYGGMTLGNDLSLLTTDSGGSAATRMTVKGSGAAQGNVGIGTTAPATPLDVNGAAQFGSGTAKSTFTAAGGLFLAAGSSLTLSGANGFLASASSVNASAFFGDGSHLTGLAGADTTRVAKTGDAMTGQLTLAVSSSMTVTGAAGVGATGLSGGTLVVRSTSTTASNPVLRLDANGGAELLRVQQDGSVGIGTASPATILDVKTSGTAAYVRAAGASDGANYAAYELWSDDPTPRKWQFAHKSAAPNQYDFQFAHFDGASWTAPFTVTNGGNVIISTGGSLGVGTGNPAAQLHVYNSGSASYVRNQGAGDGANYAAYELWSGDPNPRKWQFAHKSAAPNQYDFEFAHFDGTSWTSPVTIKENGGVGIGTTNPAALLDVNGSAQFGSGVNKSTFGAAGALTFAAGYTPVNPQDAATKNYADGQATGASGWTKAGGVVKLTNATDNAVVQSTLTVQGNAFSIGGSTLVVASGSVGIGTGSPGAKLDIFENTLDWAGLGLRTQTATKWYLTAGISGFNNNYFTIGRNSGGTSPDVTVTNAGNVGIGTSIPDVKLAIEQGGIRSYYSQGIYPTIYGEFVHHGDAGGLEITARGSTGGGSGKIRFLTAEGVPAERMRIDSSGNVAIGTTAAAGRLSVQGAGPYNSSVWGQNADLNVRSSKFGDNAAHPILQAAAIRQSLTTGSLSEGYLGFSSIDDSNNDGVFDAARIQLHNESPSAVLSPTAISFWTNTSPALDTTPATEKMRITSAGNVGIGTASPLSKLALAPDASATGAITTQAGLGANAVTLQGPGGTLNTKSGLVASWSAASAGIASGLVFGRYGSAWGTYIGFHAHPDNAAATDDFSEKMRIDGNGSVGIGTADNISFNGTGNAKPLVISSSSASTVVADNDAGIVIRNSDATSGNTSGLHFAAWNGAASGSNMNPIDASIVAVHGARVANQYQPGQLAFLTSGPGQNVAPSERMRIDSSGNVGIGTTNAVDKVTITGGNIQTPRDSYIGSSANGNAILVGTSGGAQIEFNQTGIDDQMHFITHHSGVSHARRMTIDRDGNVGIGTTSPGNKLSVGTFLANGRLDVGPISGGTLGGAQLSGFASNGTPPEIGTVQFILTDGTSGSESGDIAFRTKAGAGAVTEQVRITSGGNVGIGGTPDAKLTVNGAGSQGTLVAHITHGGLADIALFYEVAAYAPNGAATALKLGHNSSTGRSINAGGTINASGADYAEWIPWPGDKPEPGDIIRYKGTWLVVSSTRTAAFIGNDKYGENTAILVTFTGQVPVKVKGKVQEGDYILPGADETGVAVRPQNVTFEQYRRVIGVAWEASEDDGTRKINVAIGLK